MPIFEDDLAVYQRSLPSCQGIAIVIAGCAYVAWRYRDAVRGAQKALTRYLPARDEDLLDLVVSVEEAPEVVGVHRSVWAVGLDRVCRDPNEGRQLSIQLSQCFGVFVLN